MKLDSAGDAPALTEVQSLRCSLCPIRLITPGGRKVPPTRAPRLGDVVHVKGRPLRFSYWPMYRGSRRYGLQASLYATNPWAIIRSAIHRDSPASGRAEALAYLEQAQYFHEAATQSGEWAAKPLLLYYSFLNAAKSYVITRSVRPTLDRAHHGVSERLSPGGVELEDAYLDVHPSPTSGSQQVLALFWEALSGYQIPLRLRLDLPYLLPQIVTGHRIWCDVANSNERFIALEAIEIRQDRKSKELWAVLQLHSGTLSQNGLTGVQLLRGSQFFGVFRSVRGFHDSSVNETMLQYEQTTTISYSHRPSDRIPGLIEGFRHRIWTVATTNRPFREYYLYVAPTPERIQVLPQLIAVYSLAFYLGSITRYRPQHFDGIMNSPFGGVLQEFLTSQPTQFLYLLASEFARREITRPALA